MPDVGVAQEKKKKKKRLVNIPGCLAEAPAF
jgi:hypothetical protein